MSYRLEIDPDEPRERLPPRRRSPRPAVTIGIVAALVLVGGSWTLYRLTGSHTAPGAVPVLHADDRPIKVRPANPGGMKIPDQNIYVLNTDRVVDPRVEQLLPPPETPLPAPESAPSPAPAGQGAPPPVAPPPVAPAPAPVVAPAPTPPRPTPALPSPRPAAPAVSAAPPTPRPVPAAGGYRLQVGAVRSADAAKREWERLKRTQPDILGSLGFTTERIDLKSRGVFYRILAGPIGDEGRAERACNELKRRNVGCILVRP